MNIEINEIAGAHRPSFKRLVSYIYHNEPLINCDFLVEQCGSTIVDQLSAIEDAQYCASLLRDEGADYDAVHDWSQS